MKKKLIIIYQLVFFIILSNPVSAQQTLEEYINYGLKNNKDFIDQQLAIEHQTKEYQISKRKFLPNIYLDASYSLANGGRTIDIPAGDLVNPAYQGLNQLIGSNQYPTDIQNVSEQLLPNKFHETKLRLVQPILNSEIWLNSRAQSLGIQIEQIKQEALINRLRSEIKIAYYNYLAALNQVEIYKQNELLLNKLLDFNKHLVKNNKSTSEIIYDTQAQIADLVSEKVHVETKVKIARSFFNYLIGRNQDAIINIDSSAIQVLPANILFPESSDELVLSRPEIKLLEKQMAMGDLKVKMSKSYLIPKLSLIGDIGYQGFNYTFDSNQQFYLLRFSLTWSIFNGFQNHTKTKQSKIRTQQISNQFDKVGNEIKLEIRSAYYNYEQAVKAFEAAQMGVSQREKSYNIIDSKYRHGSALPISLETARTNLLAAQLKLTISKYNILISQAKLEETTSLKLSQINENY